MKKTQRHLILATLMGFLLATFISYAPVKAAGCTIPDKVNPDICLDDYFGSNDIIFYDPNAEDCIAPTQTSSGSSTLVGNSNEEKIFTYLVGKGLTTEQAAGVMGNFQQESGFDPAIRQGGAIAGPDFDPINGEGFGLAQWTFNDRQVPLETMARDTNRKIIDLGLQLDYFWFELSGRWANALTSLKAESTPERAAYVFHRDYEGSADTEAAVIQVRGGNARAIFDKYKSNLPGASASETVSSGGAQCQSAATTGSGLTSYMGDDFTIYNQCQYAPYGGPWGTQTTPYGQTMCAAACGPTALAMLAKNMTGANITPSDTIDFYTKNNYWYPSGGSLISAIGAAAGSFGLTASIIPNKGDIAAYREVFDKGGLISVSSRGTSPFLPQGHTIVLRGITAENKFMIADPGYKETNIAPANQISVDKILTDVRSDSGSASYAFYKK
jgi:hypothetical protein